MMDQQQSSDSPTPREAELARLESLLAAAGNEPRLIASITRELQSLASAVPPESVLDRARALRTQVAPPSARPSGAAWLERLTNFIGHLSIPSLDPQPDLVGVRGTTNADRLRIERTIGETRVLIECERCSAPRGWRVLGEVTSAQPLPAEVSVVLTTTSGASTAASLDDLSMFEMVVPAGQYSVGLRSDGRSLVLVERLDLM